MSIKVLSPDVASKIAAGEVVERPASIVKELVDNSIDAGATQISIEIQGGGVRLIRAVDNGVGIPPNEIDLAFERFATSKLTSADDLENIATMGFRGEALPSIAAVSEVTMVTRTEDELAGTFVNIKDGSLVQKAQRGCPTGTTVTVRNLFRSFPARLKFLKSDATEIGHINQLITQYALAFPEVRFTLVVDGRTTFRTSGSGDLREVLGVIYGVENAKTLLAVCSNEDDRYPLIPSIAGFVSPPSLTRATRSHISFFINRRWIQSRMLTYALEEAYHGLLMSGRHPLAVINVFLSPQALDVNVHPAKSEVKFRNEREVFGAVQKSVKDVIIAQSPIPTLDTLYNKPTSGPVPYTELLPSFDTPVAGTSARAQAHQSAESEPIVSSLPILRVVGQLSNMYIIAEGPDGMYLVDQHAAHERIQYEKILGQWQRKAVDIQGLLQPVPVELSVHQQELLELHSEALFEYGFDIEHFGDRTYLVRSIPAMLRGQSVDKALVEVLDFLGKGTKDADWGEGIAASLACHGAVLAGQTLNQEEMQELIKQLEKTSQPRACPHGRPTMIHLSSAQLEKGFGRR